MSEKVSNQYVAIMSTIGSYQAMMKEPTASTECLRKYLYPRDLHIR